MTKEEEKYTTLDTKQCKWWVIALFSMQKSLACQTNHFDDAKKIQSAQDKIIKALEAVEEFERALGEEAETERDKGYLLAIRDIGELLAYADEKFIRECYPSESTWDLFDLNAKYGLAELLKTWTEYKTTMNNSTAKEHLQGCNQMVFPATFEEYAKDYGFTDDKEIYTNGIHLIPVFRVQQWLEHLNLINCNNCSERRELHTRVKQWADAYKRGVEDEKRKALEQQSCDDCVSRKALINAFPKSDFYTLEDICETINFMPPVTPTFPEGETNYDVLKAVFGNISAFRIKDTMEFEKGFEHWFSKPYKRGSEND